MADPRLPQFIYAPFHRRMADDIPPELLRRIFEKLPSARDQILYIRDQIKHRRRRNFKLLALFIDIHGHKIFSRRPIMKRLVDTIFRGPKFVDEKQYARSRNRAVQERMEVLRKTRKFRKGIDRPSAPAKQTLGIPKGNKWKWDKHLESIAQNQGLSDVQKAQRVKDYNRERAFDEDMRLTRSKKHVRLLNVLVDFCTHRLRDRTAYNWRCAGCIDKPGHHTIPGTAALYCNRCFEYALNTQMIPIDEMRRFIDPAEFDANDRILPYEFITVHVLRNRSRILLQDADTVTRARFGLDFSELKRRLNAQGAAALAPFQHQVFRHLIFLEAAMWIKAQYHSLRTVDLTAFGLPRQVMIFASRELPGGQLLCHGLPGHEVILTWLEQFANGWDPNGQIRVLPDWELRFFLEATVRFWQERLRAFGYL